MITIGSSDVPLILSGRAWDVWMRLFYPEQVSRGDLPEFERGKRLEPVLATWYSEVYGGPLRKCETIFHPDYPFLRSTPDYEELTEKAYIEMKTKHWESAPATCQVEHEFQVRWHMAMGNRDMGYVYAWYMKDKEPIRWPFPRDRAFEQRMLNVVLDFYERFVREKHEPDPDTSDAYAKYLNHLPASEEGLVLDDPEHPIAILAHGLRKWALLKGIATSKEKTLKVELRDAMKKLGWIKGDFGRVSYTTVAGATHRDWEQIARWLGVALMEYMPREKAEAMFQEVLAQHTTIGQNYRRLNTRWSKTPLLGDADVAHLLTQAPPADLVSCERDPEPPDHADE